MDNVGYVIRHASTARNADGLSRGVTDIPLSQKGVAEAYNSARILTRYPVTSLRASNLERTKHHAKISGKAIGMAPVFTKKLDTLDIGALTGKPDVQIADQIKRLTVDTPTVAFPGGQSVKDWLAQIWPEINYFFILVKNGYHPVIVTHGRITNVIKALIAGDCKALCRETLSLPPTQKPAEIYAVRWDGTKFFYEGPIK